MRILENEYLKVRVSDFGAELSGIFDKKKGYEVLWQADAAYWSRHAPVLFPFVGKVNGGFYTHKGIKYPMGQHGFARDSMFEFSENDGKKIIHILRSDDNTKKVYPFDFELKITHTLEESSIRVHWDVKNIGEDIMYFSIGAHPAFNCPILPDTKQTDYYISLGEGSLSYVLIDGATGSVDYKNPHTIPAKFRISKNLFDNDALIFDDFQIKRASVLYPDGSPYITLECDGFPSFGLWSKPRSGAPYVCLEPWIGRCDNMGFSGELKDKYGEQSLDSGKTFEAEYSIKIY